MLVTGPSAVGAADTDQAGWQKVSSGLWTVPCGFPTDFAPTTPLFLLRSSSGCASLSVCLWTRLAHGLLWRAQADWVQYDLMMVSARGVVVYCPT